MQPEVPRCIFLVQAVSSGRHPDTPVHWTCQKAKLLSLEFCVGPAGELVVTLDLCCYPDVPRAKAW